jgi:hypothetical protein
MQNDEAEAEVEQPIAAIIIERREGSVTLLNEDIKK